MAFDSNNCTSFSIPPRSSSSLSSTSHAGFGAVAKAWNYVPIKLDNRNYIFWKTQVLATIQAFDLIQFLNNLTPRPKFIMDPDSGDVEATKLNDDYMDWLRSDQLLLG